MNHNSIIRLKGIQKEIYVTHDEARKITDTWQDKSVPSDSVIHLGKIHFQKGDIKYIEHNPSIDRKQGNEIAAREFYDEERNNRNLMENWHPEIKAKQLDIFSYLYRFSANKEPDQDILDKAYKIQFDFFQVNKKRTICDLHLLRSLVPMTNTNRNLWEKGFFIVVERAVFRDMQLAGQLKSGFYSKPLKEVPDKASVEEMKDVAVENRKIGQDFDDFVSKAVSSF